MNKLFTYKMKDFIDPNKLPKLCQSEGVRVCMAIYIDTNAVAAPELIFTYPDLQERIFNKTHEKLGHYSV